MNEQEVRELLKLVRGIEHFLERCLKAETMKQLEKQGIEIEEDCNCGMVKDTMGYMVHKSGCSWFDVHGFQF